MNILITGIPGTGKTTIAKRLARKLKYEYISINSIVEKYHLFSRIDTRTNSKIVYMNKLQDYLYNLLTEGDHIIDGHLGCDLDLPIDFVIVLRTHPKVLEKRLKKRDYNKNKIKENIWAEMLDYCVINSEERYTNVYEVNTTNKNIDKTIQEILDLIHKKRKSKHYDWSKIFKAKIKFSSS
ncbi:adenylate kinase family protein [Candidatus Micrarchaeota archaeon]|nr:adenylate kinase family protein [Candidatus Micrarchaeota archaeon]